MPEFVSKQAVPQRRRERVCVPGLYGQWIRTAAESRFAIEDDPRFMYDPETGGSTGPSEEEVAAAKDQAARFADDRIAEGRPLIAKLLQCEQSCWGIAFFRDRQFTKYDIFADDMVCVNVDATQRYRSRLAAELALRQAALAQYQPVVPTHNGSQVDG